MPSSTIPRLFLRLSSRNLWLVLMLGDGDFLMQSYHSRSSEDRPMLPATICTKCIPFVHRRYVLQTVHIFAYRISSQGNRNGSVFLSVRQFMTSLSHDSTEWWHLGKKTVERMMQELHQCLGIFLYKSVGTGTIKNALVEHMQNPDATPVSRNPQSFCPKVHTPTVGSIRPYIGC